MENQLTNLFRLAALAVQFCSERETLPVFSAWARKGHEEHNPDCSNPDCLFQSSQAEWHNELQKGMALLIALGND